MNRNDGDRHTVESWARALLGILLAMMSMLVWLGVYPHLVFERSRPALESVLGARSDAAVFSEPVARKAGAAVASPDSDPQGTKRMEGER